MLSLPHVPPLLSLVDAGVSALPALLKLSQVMPAAKYDEAWREGRQLPVEVPLPKEHQHHSVFCCPISKVRAHRDCMHASSAFRDEV